MLQNSRGDYVHIYKNEQGEVFRGDIVHNPSSKPYSGGHRIARSKD